MLLAFGVFTFSFIVGCLFLIQEHKIKTHSPGLLLSRLPPLGVMNSLHYKALTIGFLLLSLGILSAAFLSRRLLGRFFTGDPREIATLAVWALYAIFLTIRIRSAWRGRRGVLLSLLGFLGILLALSLRHQGF